MRKILLIIGLFLTISLSGQIPLGVVASQVKTGVDSANWEAEYKTVYYKITSAERPALDTANYQNTMVKSIKANVMAWNKVYLFYVFAQKTAAGAKINWANPGTFDLTDPGETNPTFTQYTSFHGDGSSDYFTTGLVPATHLPASALDSISICVYERESYNASYTPIGVETGTSYLKIRPRTGGATSVYLNATGGMTPANTTSIGFHIGTRRADGDTEYYQNGTSGGTDTDASTSLPATNAMAVLANNDDGTIEEFSPKKTSIIMLIGKVSDEQASALTTIIETYMDAIGKGVF